jgi:hypothetical protein
VVTGLVLVAGAAGTTTTNAATARGTQGRIEALALDGGRVAYDVGSTTGRANNKVLVWDVRTGKTTKVSGKHTATADASSTGAGVFGLAIAGSRVAWMVNEGGNLEGDDYLFTSSVTKPKERQLVSDIRYGDNCPGRSQALCAGNWLGGLVGSGNLIALNRWTTTTTVHRPPANWTSSAARSSSRSRLERARSRLRRRTADASQCFGSMARSPFTRQAEACCARSARRARRVSPGAGTTLSC